MKTVKEVLRQMTDAKSIMQDLRAMLRKIDPKFSEEEQKFLQASAALEREIGETVSPTAYEYLAAREEQFVMELIFIGWQGFRFNLDVFHNPVNALLLKGDYEDLHRERRLGTLASTRKARDTQEAFLAALKKQSGEMLELTSGITGFYSYLETTGYKAAHYFGFRLADLFLPYVVPGYTSDMVNTLRYKEALTDYLHVDADGME